MAHSAEGFSWGFQGDGPMELAMCILWDFLGHEPHPALYRKFLEDYVLRWEHNDWSLSSDAIEDWLEANGDIPREVHSVSSI